MGDKQLGKAALNLVEVMKQTFDESLGEEIAEIVKHHSLGAAAAAVAAGWVPGAGAVAAVTISTGFIWTMYGRINSKIGLPLSDNVVKSVGTGVATNLAAYVLGGLVMSAAFSFIPGLGSVGASLIAGATCYSLTLASGFVYLKVLTRLFEGAQDPATMDADSLKQAAEEVVRKEDLKAVIREAKDEFKEGKKSGEIS